MTRSLLAGVLLVSAACPVRDRVVHEGPSMFGHLVVRDSEGVRTLTVGDESNEQSAIRPGQPLELVHEYSRLLVSAFAARPKARRVLVVGLGGGALPSFLRAYAPSMRIDVVEIDPVVVDVARRYFGVVTDAHLQVHVADARAFLDQSKASWDVIFLDAYAADSIPTHLSGADFLRIVRKRLSPGGLVASNVWASPGSQYAALLDAHRTVFPELLVIDGKTSLNRVLLGFTRGAAQCATVATTAKTLALPFPLHQVVARQCSKAASP